MQYTVVVVRQSVDTLISGIRNYLTVFLCGFGVFGNFQLKFDQKIAQTPEFSLDFRYKTTINPR